jgi:hypothetical protein
MEDFTFPSVGARLKNGRVVHPFSQIAKLISNFLITPKKKVKKNEKSQKRGMARRGSQSFRLRIAANERSLVAAQFKPPDLWSATKGHRSVVGRPRLVGDQRSPASLCRCPKLPLCKIFFLLPAHIFLHMWSTLVGWLHHMPTLHRFFSKFSNTHNF